MIAAGILILAGAILLGSNLIQPPGSGTSLSPTSIPKLPNAPTIAIATDSTAKIPRVTLEIAKQAFDGKTAVFVDVRDAESYAAGHIPGALSIPLANLQNQLNELKTSDWIITYCT